MPKKLEELLKNKGHLLNAIRELDSAEEEVGRTEVMRRPSTFSRSCSVNALDPSVTLKTKAELDSALAYTETVVANIRKKTSEWS